MCSAGQRLAAAWQLCRYRYRHSSGRGIAVADVVMGLEKVRLPHDNLIATAAPPRLEGPRDGRPGDCESTFRSAGLRGEAVAD
jgi:hypothetical protein